MQYSLGDKQFGAQKKLYETVADRLSDLIAGGVFVQGQRVPSLRKISSDYGVSLSTSMEAYRLLEDWGKIEGRPQSGFYVKRQQNSVVPAAHPSSSDQSPVVVDINDLALRLLADVGDQRRVQFGSAFPDPSVLPLTKLRNSFNSVIRDDPGAMGAYDVSPGCLPFRLQVARRSTTFGCALSPDEIISTSGAQEAVSLCLRATCKAGDTVVIESPLFYGILQIIQAQGLNAIEVPSDPVTGIDLPMLALAIEKHRVSACIAVTNFSNPSGGSVPEESKRRLVELLAAQDIPLIEDDVYGDLAHGNERPSAAKAHEKSGNVLLCSSFSKTIAPGLRAGWCAPGKYYDEVLRQKIVSNLCCPTITQLAVADFLGHSGYDKHLRSARRIYGDRTHAMADHVRSVFPNGTKVSSPRGGYILWVELPASANSLRVYERSVPAGLTFAPGSVFSPSQAYSNYLRLNAAFWGESYKAPLEKLAEFARQECDQNN